MADLGLREKGYRYINIDDGYFGGRDSATGKLLIHPTRFPNGLKPVVEYIHNLGFKAGIYSDAGRNTCGSYWDKDATGQGVGLYGHELQDCEYFFKTLGFDFIKVDFCGGDPHQNLDQLDLDERTRYTAISNAIKATGRTDVRLNVCRWGFPGTWVHDIAASWRISPDINPSWESVRSIIESNMFLSAYATGGKFNDMDMLEVGRGMSEEEDKTHFGMWCIMASPLMIGKDMTNINKTTLALLTNEELIALNQDALALQAQPVYRQNGVWVLAKDMEQMYGTRRAVAVYNPTDSTTQIRLDFAPLLLQGKVKIRDVFAKSDIGIVDATKGYEVRVPAHGTLLYVLSGTHRIDQKRYEAENAWLQNASAIAGGDRIRVSRQDGTTSLGAYVSYIGGAMSDNYMEWRNVYSTEGGYKKMTIAYASGEDRTMDCVINGKRMNLGVFNSGGWQKWERKTVMVKLKKGTNVIRLENGTAFAPNVDYIEF